MWTLVVAAVTALAIWAISAAVRWWRIRSAAYKLAGAPIHPIFGTMAAHKDPEGVISYAFEHINTDCIKPLVFCMGPFLHIVALRRPADIKAVVTADEPKSTFTQSLLGNWLGPTSLILSNGDIWKRIRTLLDPAFHRVLLTHYTKVMGESAIELADKFEQYAKDPNNAVDVTKDYSLYTLDTLCRCGFSYNSGCQRNDKEEFPKVVGTMCEDVVTRVVTPLYSFSTLYNMSKDGRAFNKKVKFAHNFSQQVIEERRAKLKGVTLDDIIQHKRPSGRALFDFLDICLLARDKDGNPAMTDSEIRDQCNTVLFAGHDTTHAALSWLTYCLSLHPEDQDKCREEIFEVLGPDAAPEFEQLTQLPYTTACIKEAMRLYPPVLGVQRELQSPLKLECGVELPAHTTVTLSIILLHRNPTIWDEPEEWRPSRFLNKRVDPYSFIPFSVGNRNCIGYNFAINEIRVAMCQLLRRLKFVDAGHKPILESAVVLRSKNGVKVKIEKLES